MTAIWLSIAMYTMPQTSTWMLPKNVSIKLHGVAWHATGTIPQHVLISGILRVVQTLNPGMLPPSVVASVISSRQVLACSATRLLLPHQTAQTRCVFCDSPPVGRICRHAVVESKRRRCILPCRANTSGHASACYPGGKPAWRRTARGVRKQQC